LPAADLGAAPQLDAAHFGIARRRR